MLHADLQGGVEPAVATLVTEYGRAIMQARDFGVRANREITQPSRST